MNFGKLFGYRFLENWKRKEKLLGPKKTNETEKAKEFWIKHEQRKVETKANIKEHQRWLNLQKDGTRFANAEESKTITNHLWSIFMSIYGAVTLTISAIRENY